MDGVAIPRMDDRYALGVEFTRDRSRARGRASIVAAGLLDGWLTGHLVFQGPIDDALDAMLWLHGLHRAPAVPARRVEVVVPDPDDDGPVPDRTVYADEYEQPPTRRRVGAVAVDRRGPACTLIRPLEKAARVKVVAANGGDLAEAHGLYLDALANRRLRIIPDERLDAAMRHGEQRPAGDATAWSMRGSDEHTHLGKALELAVWVWLTTKMPSGPDIF